MQDFLEFRDALIDYLIQQKQLEQDEIDKNKLLTEKQKIEKGLLIKDAIVVSIYDTTYQFQTEEDNTKLKVGDNVIIRRSDEISRAKVIDNGLDSISLETTLPLHLDEKLSIEIIESVYLNPLIALLESIDEGKPGAYFLKQLAEIEIPLIRNLGSIDINSILNLPNLLNERQLEVIGDALKRPSTYCIQGPPGTGKTAVLASIANCFSEKHKDVLIISNTHQAVNNALNKVIDYNSEVRTVKIGEALKAEGLDSNILVAENYSDYLKNRKNLGSKRKNGDIVGMTLHSAVINLGLRNSGFQPQMVLVDEAGQMPMPYASVIGAFGSGSIIFIGDDKQMPPIFHPELSNHDFSCSIFSYICKKHPNLRKTLNVTYRMNEEITTWIDSHFYGAKDPLQKIIASDYSKNRKFPIEVRGHVEPEIKEALSSSSSISYLEVDPPLSYTEANPYEAQTAFKLVEAAVANGLSCRDIAIITPFRKQVKMIRSVFNDAGWSIDETPIINTVECLQGQDVECIIISFSVSDEAYFWQHYEFIADEHRLNVMVSRAKSKVIMLGYGKWKEKFK